jgi:glycosyltransferase involved in cell wall biosynthesis
MNKQKRLCIVYWSLGLGGIQKRICDIVSEISKQYPQWDVYLLLRRKSEKGLDKEVENIPRIKVRYYSPFSPVRLPLGFVFWVIVQYIRIKPNTVLTFQCLLSAVILLCRRFVFWIPVEIVLNEGAVTSPALRFEGLSRYGRLISLLYRQANVIIVPTKACKKDLVTCYRVPEKIITVVPNWTLYPRLAPVRFIYDILYVGRFDKEKNPFSVISVTKLVLPRVSLLRTGMAGDGPLKNVLFRSIHRERLTSVIQVLPYSQNVSRLLSESRVLYVPSFNEGMPNVVLEAAMCGVPSVVNCFPGADEVVKHGKTGYISTSDTEAAGYILRLLSRERQRNAMGQRAQRHVYKHHTYGTQKQFIDTILSEAHH